VAAIREPDDRARPPWGDEFFRHPRHGPLPVLLVGLTVVTGLVDAVSLLSLGRVFVANMTGNIVFIGFGLVGAPGFSAVASLIALAGFLLGAAGGGILHPAAASRGRLLALSCAISGGLIAAAGLLLVLAGTPLPVPAQIVGVALIAVALGLQNATVRRLAVPDFTTTVLTMTLTGLAADIRRRDARASVRRIVAVAAMLLGAALGALLVLAGERGIALFSAAAICVAVAGAAAVGSRRDGPWDEHA
jgi:uncharacterized membrane protein YoaK (UPF0700 family)